MNDNNTVNPFEEANNSDQPTFENNDSEFVDFGSSLQNEPNDFINNEETYYEEENSPVDYEPEETSEEMELTNPKKNDILKKIPIVILIIILIIILILLLKSLLSPEEPNDNNFDENTQINTNKDETTLNKRIKVTSTLMANGNILLDIHNKNKNSVDANVTLDFNDANNEKVNTEEINIKNIPANSHYYESVYVKPELQGNQFNVDSKLTLNRFKDYYNEKISIINKTENEENLLVEIKNDSIDTIDVIEIYAIYYDSDDNIIGFDKNYAKKIAADKTTTIKINYPKNSEFKYISFSKYDIGINTAYSYKSN